MLDRRLHDATLELAAVDHLAQASRRTDAVDRAHVVLVAVLDRNPALDVDAERGPEQLRFDVVDGERVAREKHLHIAELDEPREVDARPCVNNRRAGHDENPSAAVATLAHLIADARDQQLLRLLGRDLAAHEAEDLRLARALERRDAHAVMADHDLHPTLGVLEDDAPRPPGLAVDGDRRVHLDALDGEPASVDEHLRRQVAGRIEPLREHPLAHDLVGADRLLVLGRRPQGAGALHDPVELLRGFGVNLHPAQRRVRLVLAGLELLDREIAADVHDHVHDLRQHHRVDDVALQDKARRMPARSHQRTPAAALT